MFDIYGGSHPDLSGTYQGVCRTFTVHFEKFNLLIEFSKINSILKISCGNFPKYNLKNPKYNLEKIQFDKLEIIRKKGTGHFDEKCRWLGRKLGLFASDAFPTLVGGQH